MLHHCDIGGVDNPRGFNDIETEIIFFGECACLSDSDVEHASLAEHLRAVLEIVDPNNSELFKTSEDVAQMAAALEANSDVALLYLSAKKVDDGKGEMTVTRTPNANTNGVIEMIRSEENDYPTIRNWWKEYALSRCEEEARVYGLYLAGKVYTLQVQHWQGEGNAEEHLEDEEVVKGDGFRADDEDIVSPLFLDLDNTEDIQEVEELVAKLFR